jgi:SAM-dependent methyltransferase
MTSTAPTLRLELYVPGVVPEVAFDLLISELGAALGRIGQRLEPGADGQLFERTPTGDEREFARVTAWERGRQIQFDWHPVGPEVAPEAIPVSYRFEKTENGTTIGVEYGPWLPSTPIATGMERVGWFASVLLPGLLQATAPLGFGDWWTDRVARRPSGPSARKTYADPIYHRPNFLLILDRLHLTADDRLLEVGCGGGAFLHDALESGCRAWAIDHSPTMVQLAREQNRAAIEERRATIEEGDAHHLPFPDASCTCAVTTGSFGFWDRPIVGLAEIRRVLAPGGRFVMFSGSKELRGTPAASEPIASRVHWYEDDELVAMAREAGFVAVRVDRPDMVPYARKASLPPDAVAFFDSLPSTGQLLEARGPPG